MGGAGEGWRWRLQVEGGRESEADSHGLRDKSFGSGGRVSRWTRLLRTRFPSAPGESYLGCFARKSRTSSLAIQKRERCGEPWGSRSSSLAKRSSSASACGVCINSSWDTAH